MRILFDGYWWQEGPISNRMVEKSFVSTWLRAFPEDEATLVVPGTHVDSVRAQLPDVVDVVGTSVRPHGLAAMFALPAIARRVAADVTVAHNFTPIAGNAVTFIHDVLFQTDPTWFTAAERVYLSAIPWAARRAGCVTTSSAHEAQRIKRANPALREVVPVGIAINQDLINAQPQRPAGLAEIDAFVLTVGRLNVRKNLARTIDAALDSGCIGPSFPLVVVGESDGRGEQFSPSASAALRSGAVILIGHVTDAELAWLYTNTDLFIFLSLGEGFGLPPVEARYFGARVLASDIPLFHETLPNDTSFVDPADARAIVSCMQHVLREPDGRRAAHDRTWQLAATDWSACTARLREVAIRVANS